MRDPLARVSDTVSDIAESLRPRPQDWNTTLPVWGLPTAALPASSAPLCLGSNFSIECACTAVQLVLQNQGTVPLPVSGLIVASSASNIDEVTPVDSSGAPASWSIVTVDGLASFTIPAAVSAAQPTKMLSDIIPLESFLRTDSGLFPLIFTRLLMADSPQYTVGLLGDVIDAAAYIAAYKTATRGRSFQTWSTCGDYVSPDSRAHLTDAIITATDSRGCYFGPVCGIRYMTKRECHTILAIGDSLTRGVNTTSQFNGFALQAASQLTVHGGLGIAVASHGYAGQVSSDFVANGKTAIDLFAPSIVTIPIESPDDYTGVSGAEDTATTRQAAQDRCLNLADYALTKGITTVLISPIPFGAYDTAANYGAARVVSGDVARKLAKGQLIVVDAQKIISDYVPTAAKLPTLPVSAMASDGAHLNDFGQSLLADEMVRQLRPLLNI